MQRECGLLKDSRRSRAHRASERPNSAHRAEGMPLFLEAVALGDLNVSTFNAGDPSLEHTVCYEVVAQRWRPWAGDMREVQAFRSAALQRCGVEDRGMQKPLGAIGVIH